MHQPRGYAEAASTFKKHETFFSQEVYFAFNGTLYRFPRYYLEESIVFQKIIRNGQSVRANRELRIFGDGSVSTPFVCLTVKKEMFESLLLLLSSMIFDPKTDLIRKQQWLDILEISCMWEMEKVTSMAISYLLKMEVDAIIKLELAERHGIQHKVWRLSAIRDLVRGNGKVTVTDTERIGADIALKISRVQGMAREHPIISGIDRYLGTKNISWLDAYIYREFPDLF